MVECNYNYSSNESFLKRVEEILAEHNKAMSIEKNEYFEYSLKDDVLLVCGLKGRFSNNYVSVATLWVDEKYKNKYLGNKLINYLEEVARERGFDNIILSTCTFQAKRFYEKLGYNVIGITKDVPLEFDYHIMIKRV